MPRFSLVLLAACCLTTPTLAQEKIKTLTPETVSAFVNAMTEKTKPGGRLKDEQVIAYLNTHLFDLGDYNSSVTFNVPHHHPQTRAIQLTKAQFISNVIAGRQSIRQHQSGVAIHDIEIADNNQEATFRTVTSERGEMPIEGQYVSFTGETECIQKIALDGAIPVILSADCTSDMTFIE